MYVEMEAECFCSGGLRASWSISTMSAASGVRQPCTGVASHMEAEEHAVENLLLGEFLRKDRGEATLVALIKLPTIRNQDQRSRTSTVDIILCRARQRHLATRPTALFLSCSITSCLLSNVSAVAIAFFREQQYHSPPQSLIPYYRAVPSSQLKPDL